MASTDGDELRLRRGTQYRIHALFFFIFLCFSILIIRLAWIQIVQKEELTVQEMSRATRTVYIAPIRGNIYDRNGYPIAYSTSAQSLYYRIEPGQTLEKHKKIAHALAQLFAKYDPQGARQTPREIFESLDVGRDYDGNRTEMTHLMYTPRRIKIGLTQMEIATVLSHPERYPGVEIVEESVRHYDSNTIAAQLVGYLKPFSVAKNQTVSYLKRYQDRARTKDYLLSEDVGFDGIELVEQERLRGKAGERKYPVNSQDQIIGAVTTTPPQKGNNVYLTLDKDVQLATEQAIMDHLSLMKSSKGHKYLSLGEQARMGFAVAMEVDTGNVLAMASMPDYDPNVWSNGISTRTFQAIQPYYQNGTIKTVYADIVDAKQRARHPTSIVPLGSTIKPLTVLIGLQEQLFSPATSYVDTGKAVYGRDSNTVIRNALKAANGRIRPDEAIAVSSNTFMVDMVGLRLYGKYGGESGRAIAVWDDYMKQFGLGVSTGSGLPMESAGVIDYRGKSSGSVQNAMAMASFGQQGRYTTLQLAQYAAMLANRGKRLRPQFVGKLTDFEGAVVHTAQREVLNTFDAPMSSWETVHRGMEAVTKSGTLRRWFGQLPFDVASKTGTSQQVTSAGIVENSVFIAYAPAQQPKIAVAVVVPWGGFGGWGAAPIAAKIFAAVDAYVGIPKTPTRG